MILRKYNSTDCEQLAELFYDTVHTVNAEDYTEEQLNVWATGQIDLEKWNASFEKIIQLLLLKKIRLSDSVIWIKQAILTACMSIKIIREWELPLPSAMNWKNIFLPLLLHTHRLRQDRFLKREDTRL